MTISELNENYFNYLPIEIIERIIVQHPLEVSQVCKEFYTILPSALKNFQWNLLKNNENFPLDFKNKLVEIEKSLPPMDRGNGYKLFREFFSNLHKSKDSAPLKELDFSIPGAAMLTAWKADQDYNLVKCWSRIQRLVHFQNPTPNTAQGIRTWMNEEENKKTLAEIEVLDLSGIKLTNLPIEIIDYCKSLTKLDLSKNKLTTLPAEIGNLTALTELNLWENKLTMLPDTIGNLIALTKLHTQINKLTMLPKEIGKLTALKSLYISFNALKEIPDSIENLTLLTKFIVNNNQLTMLPKEIGKLILLTELEVDNNELTTLPDEIGDLKELTKLDISKNELILIPKTIGNLCKMKELFLDSNRLTQLPMEFANVGRLHSPETTVQVHNTLTIYDTNELDIRIINNILLAIPTCLVKKKGISNISLRLKKQNCTLLNSVSQFIRNNSDAILENKFTQAEELGKLVDALDASDREIIDYRIWELAWGKNDGNLNWGQKNRFNNISLFVSVFGELLYSKQTE